MKKTKILCTIGPSSASKEVMDRLVRAGMNGIRINTAYGDFARYESIIDVVRAIADIPIMFDIKGPEVRLHVAHRMAVEKDQILKVGFKGEELSFNHNFYDFINVNDVLLIDNGKIQTRVVEKNDGMLHLLFFNGGTLDDGKGVNIPNKQLFLPTFRKEDLEIIKYAIKHDVEYFALSFVRNARDLENFKEQTKGRGALIAKIENFEGVDNFNEILEAADGIMVARGDLGIEIEPEKVPLVQKSIIRKCNQQGKPVIVATEMLESMIQRSNPTRAEVSDVANAILDGTDTVMLSGETAIGNYPVEAVETMNRIAVATESAAESQVADGVFVNISDAISKAIQRICQNMPIDKVITLTRSGYTAKMIARLKIQQPIIAVTPSQITKRQLELVFGVLPVQIDYLNEEDRIFMVANKLRQLKFIGEDETVLFTSAVRTSLEHASNSIEIHRIKNLN